jgi:hypothetical protein
MFTAQIIQGRTIAPDDLALIQQLLAQSPHASRRQISLQLAARWNWRNPNGQLKDMAARSLLLKLHARSLIALPPRQRWGGRMPRRRLDPQQLLLPSEPIRDSLAALQPLRCLPLQPRQPDAARFAEYLARYHYLGYSGAVGHHLGYLVQDRCGRDLACVLFGAAAWKCQPRDLFVGWTDAQRRQRLVWIANNSRFLILPGVAVAHLASHLLGAVVRRLRADWWHKYAQPLVLVETFVERDRFAGTCYRAANWIHVGTTQGRSRQDRDHCLHVPVKDIYLYPLVRHFRRVLGA